MALRVPAAQGRPVLEGMEPRVLLSGDSALVLPASLASGPAGDTTDRFQWSGYQFQAATGNAVGQGPTASTVLDYDFSGTPSLGAEQSGFVVNLDGEGQWVSANDPIVPYRESKILLPPGYQIVSVDVQPGPGQVVGQAVPLLAAPAPMPLIDGQDPGPDPPAVLADESFPDGQEVTWSTQVMCGYSLGVLAVFPVSFDAADGTLTYYPHIQVTVTAAPAGDQGDAPLRDNATDLQRVLGLVDNDSAVTDYPPVGVEGAADLPAASLSASLPSAGPYEYVLVTSSALAGTFQQLINQKLARGISATIVTTDYIYSHYNSPYANENDDPGKIRAFLKDAYTNWGTHYVLLGGDIDQVPARTIYCTVGSYSADMTSDVYYAALDGPYNSDDDSHWGETNDGASGHDVDLATELSVGRAPVDTIGETQNFINKTILYENTPPPNPTQMVQVGEQLDSTPTWGGDSLDYIAHACFPQNLQVTTLYDRDGTNTLTAVKAALNASPNFVDHLGHSSYTNNLGHVPGLSRTDVDNLTNAFPYIVYSQGCMAGQFEQNDAIAEHQLYAPDAAVAAIMNTSYGWYTPGYAAGAGTQWALTFWEEIFDNDVLALGDAHYATKAAFLSTLQAGTTDRWTFFSSTLFGDPETHVYYPTVDGPHVTSQSPEGDVAAGQSCLRVQFGEPMDPASFSLADDLVSFTAPGGYDLRGQVTGYVWRDFYTLDILFTPQTAPGKYEMVLGPGILDTNGKAMDQDGDGTPGEPGQDAYHATFTIAGAGSGSGTIYQADMSVDPQWTIIGGSGDNRWAWGVPAGVDSDPTSGHTGQDVLGYNLNGSYPNNMAVAQYAVTPVIDCSDFQDVTLSFWRWLRVHSQPYDYASIDVTNDGVTWYNVWTNTTGVYDTAWTQKTIDISAYADGQRTVQIRWGMGPTNATVTYGGWNIDDVLVTGSEDYPTVLAQSPAAASLAGLDHLDVTFSGSVNPASVSADDFALTGPGGTVAVTSVQNVQGSTYRANFAPLTALGTYQFTVGPNVTNLLGFPMDQNGDGTPGQAGVDAYHGSFQIVAPDTVGPAVASSTPAGVGTAAVASFVFTFDEDMDTTSFCLADVAAFTGPGGSLLASITGFLWLDPRDLEVVFHSQPGVGSYAMTIGPDIRDDEPGGKAMDQNGDGTAGQPADTYTARYRITDADLSGTSFAISPASLDSDGGTTLATFKIRNAGTADSGPFDVRFYLSADADINPATDVPLTLDGGASFYQVADLAGGSELTASVRLAVPATDPLGGNNDYRIGMVVDADQQVPEVNETNNSNNGIGLDLAAAYYGRIFGKVWLDTDGDAVVDTGELGLAQRTVYLDTNNNGLLDPGETSVLTAADGSFVFRYLPDGQYEVRQAAPAGWGLSTQAGAGGAFTVTLASGQTATNLNFGDYQYATLSGTVYVDVNLSGTRDAGEAGSAGQTVYLDTNGNGALDAGEPSVLTGPDGSFAFTNLAPGTYRIRQAQPGGWVSTAPASGYYSATLTSGSAVASQDFGGYQYASLSGTVYVDGNFSGARDAGEGGSPGRTVYLDTNGNGALDAGEPSVLTGPDGSFAFANLTPGTYSVRQVLPGGWDSTAPAAGGYSVALASGAAVGGLDFGNVDSGTFPLADAPDGLAQGVRYALYHFDNASTVDDLNALTPVARGPAANFDLSLSDRQEDFGFIYSGYVHVPADGIYTFYTDSQDGSKLYIDGAAVVDNDGCHAAQEASGRIGLKAGDHAITVEYFQDAGQPLLAVSYEGAGLAKQAIADSALLYTPNIPPVAAGDAYQAHQDASLSVPVAAGVLANDTDPDSGPAGLSVDLASVGLPAHGQLQLQADGSLIYTPAPGYWGADSFTYCATDGFDTSAPATVSITVAPTPAVAGRYVFYNDSVWDSPAKGGTDADAIATDKQALLPGQHATFANYTDYSLGLNGIMIDVLGLPAETLSAQDFVFRVGNSNTPAAWAAAPAASISVRKGAGVNGTDRVVLTWPDRAIIGQWLQVTLLADADTQLPADDVFYFGNAPAEVGNSPTDAKVTVLDVSAVRCNQTTFMDPPSVTNPYDIDRDGKVNTIDVSLARADQTTFLNALVLISAPPASGAPATLSGGDAGDQPLSPAALASAEPAFAPAPLATLAASAAAEPAAEPAAELLTPAAATTSAPTAAPTIPTAAEATPIGVMTWAAVTPVVMATAAFPAEETLVWPVPAQPASLDAVLVDLLSLTQALPLPLQS